MGENPTGATFDVASVAYATALGVAGGAAFYVLGAVGSNVISGVSSLALGAVGFASAFVIGLVDKLS